MIHGAAESVSAVIRN